MIKKQRIRKSCQLGDLKSAFHDCTQSKKHIVQRPCLRTPVGWSHFGFLPSKPNKSFDFRCAGGKIHNGTRLALVENVVSGSVHKACAETFAHGGEYVLKTIHVATEDTGFAAIKRYRGWKHIWISVYNLVFSYGLALTSAIAPNTGKYSQVRYRKCILKQIYIPNCPIERRNSWEWDMLTCQL